MENFEKLLQLIPAFLEFFVPGYITIFVFRTIRDSSEQFEDSENIRTVTCICVSFMLNVIYSFINIMWLRVIAEIVTGCVLAIGFVRVLRVGWIRRHYSLINHTMIADSVFESIGLHLTDQWISAFLKDGSMIYGRIIAFGSQEHDPWLAIDCYKTKGPMFDKEDKKIDDWNQNEDKSINHVITISYGEIIAITHHKNK